MHYFPLVLRHCGFGDQKSIQLIKPVPVIYRVVPVEEFMRVIVRGLRGPGDPAATEC